MRKTKNLTLALDEDLLLRARIIAARRGTSVTGLVRLSLEEIVSGDRNLAQATTRLKALMHSPRLKVGNRRWTRDELHERS